MREDQERHSYREMLRVREHEMDEERKKWKLESESHQVKHTVLLGFPNKWSWDRYRTLMLRYGTSVEIPPQYALNTEKEEK